MNVRKGYRFRGKGFANYFSQSAYQRPAGFLIDQHMVLSKWQRLSPSTRQLQHAINRCFSHFLSSISYFPCLTVPFSHPPLPLTPSLVAQLPAQEHTGDWKTASFSPHPPLLPSFRPFQLPPSSLPPPPPPTTPVFMGLMRDAWIYALFFAAFDEQGLFSSAVLCCLFSPSSSSVPLLRGAERLALGQQRQTGMSTGFREK